MTGHDDGVVTIALAEADSAEIEKRRTELAEPYRSLLGHFRHEVGHHYWDILVRDGGKLEQCRAVFGDNSRDYEAALLPDARSRRRGSQGQQEPYRGASPNAETAKIFLRRGRGSMSCLRPFCFERYQ